jgi:GntR family transcriptional regulator, transcriptional repressor for pyruvate dehydrogenase complex
MSGDDDNQLIAKLRAPATYELVVDQLRRAIALGRFVPGGKLPPERELASQLGVSRTSVREAIRALEGEGLLEVRRGSAGGVLIKEAPLTQPTYEELRNQAEVYEEIVDFRLANECAAARLAAGRHTEEQLRGIEQLMSELEENGRSLAAAQGNEEEIAHVSTEFGRLDTKLHLTIARASGNRYLIEAVETGRIDMLRPVGSVFSSLHGNVNHLHREIVDAIAAGDGDAAATAMAAHIESTRQQLADLVRSRRPEVVSSL